jgi:hypothetical protein
MTTNTTGAIRHDLMAIAQVYLVQVAVRGSGDDAVTSDEIIFACYGISSSTSGEPLYSKR